MMIQIKQVLAFALLLQLFGLVVFCDAGKHTTPLLARRLLEEVTNNDLERPEVAEFANTGLQSANATVEIGFEESFEQQNLFFEDVDGDEYFEDGRRSLVTCGPNPTNPGFKVHSIRVNGKCLSKNEPLKVPRYARITVDVEDEEVHCPRCVEQIYFGILDGQRKCVNTGWRNFGRKRISTTVVLEPGYHWVYINGGWMYHCDDIDFNREVWHHWDSAVYGLLYVE